MVSMDRTIVSIALPAVVADLKATGSYAWIASAYIFAGALVLPVAGRLLDLKNGKRLMLLAISVFLAGSALCGLAQNAAMLIVARFIQGLGGGSFLAMGAGLVGLLFPPKQRAMVAGRLGMTLAVAGIAGPVIGGLLTHHLGWRWVFLVNIPTGLAVLVVLWRTLEDLKPASDEKMDWMGALSVTFWSLPLLILTSQTDFSSFGKWRVAAVMAFIAAAFCFFVYVEKRSKHPLFDFGMLRNPVFFSAVIGIWWLGAASTSTAMYFPLFLIQVLGQSTMHAGLTLTAMVLGVMTGSQLLGRLGKVFGKLKPVLLLGTCTASVSLFSLAWRLTPNMPHTEVVCWLAGIGLGLGMSVSGFPVVVQNATEKARIGTATASVQFAKAMGAALGTATLGAMLTSTLGHAFPQELRQRLEADGLPHTLTVFQEPHKVEEAFQKSFQELKDDISKAQKGDRGAAKRVESHPFFPSESQNVWQDDASVKKLEQFLDQRFKKLSADLTDAAETAFTLAITHVLQAASAAAFLAFCFVLLMKEKDEDSSQQSPQE